ncbi:MAG: anti-sigma F factor antagonist [Clostridia bacterium]|nr:anti-sigma F factor antagonist [Clostridia bacterium]
MIYLQIKFTSKGNTLIAGVVGELDHHSADYIRQKLDAELVKASNKNIIFDLSKMSFMDSSGIGIIMGRYKNIQKLGGKASLVGLSDQSRRIFEMSGLLKIVPAYETIDEALKNM